MKDLKNYAPKINFRNQNLQIFINIKTLNFITKLKL